MLIKFENSKRFWLYEHYLVVQYFCGPKRERLAETVDNNISNKTCYTQQSCENYP